MPHKDPAKRRIYNREYQRAHPEQCKVYQARSREKHPRKRGGEVSRKQNLAKYGLSITDYDLLLESQNHLCRICRLEVGVFCVDHCHTSGKIRGLLCRHCNLGLGHFRDNPSLLFAAIEYLNSSVTVS